jgi:hypothetical protein
MPGYIYKGDQPHVPLKYKSTGRPPTFRAELCGTEEGYMQHYRWKRKQCDACKAAHAREFMRPLQEHAQTVWETNIAAEKIGSTRPNKTAPDVLSTRTPGPD